MKPKTLFYLGALLSSPLVFALPPITSNYIPTSLWSCSNFTQGDGAYSFDISFPGSGFEPAFATFCQGARGAGKLQECESVDVSSEMEGVGEGEEGALVVVEHTWFMEQGAHYWLTGNRTVTVEGYGGSFEIVPDRARAVA